MPNIPIYYFVIAGVVIVAFLVFIFLLKSKKKKTRLFQSLGMALFLIKIPKYEKREPGDKPEMKALISSMEQIFSPFLHLKKPNVFKRMLGEEIPRVALEVASEVGGSDISFYLAVPSSLESGLEKNIQGVYPQATVEKIPQDYTVFEPKGEVVGSRLFLQKPLYFPLKTYQEMESDPINSITNALSKIAPEEGAAVQLILKPAPLSIKYKADKLISAVIEKGISLQKAVAKAKKSGAAKLASDISEDLLLSAKKPEDAQAQQWQKSQKKEVAEQPAIEAVRGKVQKPLMAANIRLIGVGQTGERAKEILTHLEGAFGQFTSVFNSLKPVKVRKRAAKKFIYDFSFRNFNPKEQIVLNLEELASLYHFPLSHITSPHIKWAKTREIAPPSELPQQGLNLIGESLFRGEQKPIYFASREDRRRHFYIIGQTGVGKSSLLREMVRQDMEKGEGVAVIDPNGDLIEDTLANIPKERFEDVVLFEPFDMESPCGLNMLEWGAPEQKDFAISEMITIFSKLFPPEIIGPMFEHYMRNAMLALMADREEPGTLVEIPRIFTDKEFMENRLQKVKDPLVRSFWLREWAQTTGQTRSDMLGYVVSKVGRFVENEMMRNIIGQSRSTFDLSEVMDKKKIFLANLSKGQTGEMNSSLLGLILVSKMQIAAFRRGAVPLEQREDFYLYIDEFQNFTTDSIATILSEARKYRLNLILAHQFIPQLTEEIRNAVIGNVGSMAVFRVGADDAEFLEKQFEPEFSKFDLLNIDNFQFLCKIMLNNTVSSPFKVKTIKPKEGNREMVSQIKQISKQKYGRPRAVVEQEIKERARLGI